MARSHELALLRRYSVDATYKYVKDFFHEVCANTHSPLSERALRLSREGNDAELCRLKILPSDYSTAASFCQDYAIVNFLSKWKGLKTKIDTKQVALSAFRKQEVICQQTNMRLKSRNTNIVTPIFHRAQYLIAKLLGPFNVDLFRGHERWGPGATTDMSRRSAYLDEKISNFPIPVTLRCQPYLAKCIEEDLHWSFCVLGDFPVGPYSLLPSCFIITRGSEITTVPKSAKTDRTIAIEPRGNMFLQKAVGKVIRKKLKRYGVDLDDQTLNQRLAALCQQEQLATIDMSMASDSVTLELIYELLPVDWALYLDCLRSKEYTLDGAIWHRFEKFSSMGNGFTFELESLIFWGLAKASLLDECSTIAVYGDDIILPQRDAACFISTLSFAGFSVNDDKSFTEGLFYESCGKHYFDGVDVTPIYQKEIISDLPELVRFCNRIARFLIRTVVDEKLSGPWLKPWFRSVSHFSAVRGAPSIPFGIEGDDGYLVNHQLAPVLRQKPSYGSQWRVLRRSATRIPARDDALLAYVLRQNAERTLVSPSSDEDAATLESREQDSRYSITTRWIEPPWEFALD